MKEAKELFEVADDIIAHGLHGYVDVISPYGEPHVFIKLGSDESSELPKGIDFQALLL